MKIKQSELIDTLITLTESALASVNKFQNLTLNQLNFKENESTWSILECCEHLNLYGDFYLPEIEKQLLSHPIQSKELIFKSGILGNYFAHLMKSKNGKIKKMKSPKDKNPSNSELTFQTLDRLKKQLELLKQLLNQSRNVDLTKAKTSISISKLIQLRLGDTFRFFTYHIERHIAQAKKIQKITNSTIQ